MVTQSADDALDEVDNFIPLFSRKGIDQFFQLCEQHITTMEIEILSCHYVTENFP
jgi:hypothetical protein